MSIEIEKLSEKIEARFYEFGRRIADFDSLRDEIKQMRWDLKYAEEAVSVFKDLAISKADSASKKHEALDKYAHYLESKILKLAEDKDSCDHGTRLQELESFKSKHHELQGKVTLSDANIKDLHSSKAILTDAIKTHSGILAQVESRLDSYNVDIEELNKDVVGLGTLWNAQTHALEIAEQCLEQVRRQTEKTEHDLLVDIKNLQSKMEAKMSVLESSFDKKMAALPQTDLSAHVTKDELIKFSDKIDLITLDAKNSLLRSNNNETQNQIILKKIENIQILLKSYDLSKQ